MTQAPLIFFSRDESIGIVPFDQFVVGPAGAQNHRVGQAALLPSLYSVRPRRSSTECAAKESGPTNALAHCFCQLIAPPCELHQVPTVQRFSRDRANRTLIVDGPQSSAKSSMRGVLFFLCSGHAINPDCAVQGHVWVPRVEPFGRLLGVSVDAECVDSDGVLQFVVDGRVAHNGLDLLDPQNAGRFDCAVRPSAFGQRPLRPPYGLARFAVLSPSRPVIRCAHRTWASHTGRDGESEICGGVRPVGAEPEHLIETIAAAIISM